MAGYGDSALQDNSIWASKFFGNFGFVDAYLSLYNEEVYRICKTLQKQSVRAQIGWNWKGAKKQWSSIMQST